jgi:transcriptional regulator with XRE-family HTH domain
MRERRKAARLTQQRVAGLAGCSIAMVRLLEGGYSQENSDVAARIDAVLKEAKVEASPEQPARSRQSTAARPRTDWRREYEKTARELTLLQAATRHALEHLETGDSVRAVEELILAQVPSPDFEVEGCSR